jgi:hypothetical protein
MMLSIPTLRIFSDALSYRALAQAFGATAPRMRGSPFITVPCEVSYHLQIFTKLWEIHPFTNL